MKKQFAFILMGAHYDPQTHQAVFETDDQLTYIYTVPDLAAAEALAARLAEQGVGAIELCGAFGPQGARCVSQAVQNSIPVGYVTHLPEQDAVYRAAFPAQD